MYGEIHKPSINLSVYLLLPQSVCGTFDPDDIKIKKQFDFVESSYYYAYEQVLSSCDA